ncbi:hypothetical protein ONA91_41285, partial [Micromonospora sp. DR5-3]|uniref:hypothetical protein n=1 Tax=Micromonospora sp. DR5-3 TaxID=2992129 RepID=UPI00222FF23D
MAAQPRRRSAIHAFDGNRRPPASTPLANTSISAVFQRSANMPETMPATKSAHQPIRCASTACERTSPVFSSTQIAASRGAHAVRKVSPSASGGFPLT